MSETVAAAAPGGENVQQQLSESARAAAASEVKREAGVTGVTGEAGALGAKGGPAQDSRTLLPDPLLKDIVNRTFVAANDANENNPTSSVPPTQEQIANAEAEVTAAKQASDASPEDEQLKKALITAQNNLADLKSKTGGRRRTKRKQQKKGKSSKKGGKKHRKSYGNKSRRNSSKKSRRHGRK